MPAAITVIDELPLTVNGKVDRKALPEVDIAADADNYQAPRTAVESLLGEIWAQAEVLTPEERHARRTGKIPAGRPINESARIDIRIEPALKQWADAYARSLGIKVSGLIRMLLSKERQKVESER